MLHPLNWSSALPAYVAAFAFGYLCGSIPFGVLLTRLAGVADVRAIGSGNIGATNVLRTGRKGLAAATLLGDMLKGTVAVLLTAYVLGRDFAVAAAVGAFLGHLFPVWLRFRGGKGVATYIGLLLGAGLGGGDRVLRDLARGCRTDPLLVACGADRQRRHAGVPVVAAATRGTHNCSCCCRCCYGSCTAPTSCDFSAARKEKSEPVQRPQAALERWLPRGSLLAMPQSFSPSRSRLLALCSRPDC